MIIEIKVKTKSPLVISSTVEQGATKKYIELNGKPVIPGSSLKGAFREHAGILYPKYKDIIANLLGTEKNQGKLHFGKLETKNEDVMLERSHNSIDRKTRTAAYKKLFDVVAVRPGVEFTGYIYSKENLNDEEMKVLQVLSNLTIKIGSMKSRGYGFVEITMEKSDTNEQFSIAENSKTMLLTVEPKEPLVITEDRVKSYLYNSADFIPGSTLRGAYATFFDPSTDEFKKIFLEEKVKFSNLYPSSEGISYPADDFLLSEKYSVNSSIKNTLAEYLVINILNKNNRRLSLKTKSEKDRRLDRLSGWINHKTGKIVETDIDSYVSTQVALNKNTRSAEDGALRTYNAYTFGKLSGIIRAEEIKYLDLLNQKWLTLGGSKTRGFGLVKVQEFTPLSIDFRNNLVEFNNKVKNLINEPNCNTNYIPVILRSDLILGNTIELNELLGSDYELELKQIRKSEISGWNVASRCPKSYQEVIGKGSALVYSTKKNIDEINEILKNLYVKGIGKFTGSGFGEFIIGR